jgi:hypothetical protein
MSRLRKAVQRKPGSEQFFSDGLTAEALRSEIFFLAYHLHWSWQELMELESAERRAFVLLLVEQIERENERIHEAGRR